MVKGSYTTPCVEEVFRVKAMNVFMYSSNSMEDSIAEGDDTTITPIM